MDGCRTDSRSPLPEAPSPAGVAQVSIALCLYTNTTSVNRGGPGSGPQGPGNSGSVLWLIPPVVNW